MHSTSAEQLQFPITAIVIDVPVKLSTLINIIVNMLLALIDTEEGGYIRLTGATA